MEQQGIYDLLKKDHRTVENLMTQSLQGQPMQMGGAMPWEDPYSKLKQQLTAHMDAEEQVFYDQLKINPDLNDLISESIKQHNEFRAMLKETDSLSKNSPEWKTKMQDMQTAVLNHVKLEETKVFDEAHKVLNTQQSDDMGRQFQQVKARITNK